MTIVVTAMTGFATIQDMGRPGYQADGVPRSGAMDARSLACANAAVGNCAGAAAIEWALAGGSLEFRRAATVCIAGADVALSRNGSPVSAGAALEFAAADRLTVERFHRGAYIYVAFAGGIDVPLVLGSRSTYLPAAFGGLDGRRLRTGDALTMGIADATDGGRCEAAAIGAVSPDAQVIRAIEGPNAATFPAEFREAFWACEFTVSGQSNRIGYRVEREPVIDPANRSAASEPACVGAIQVPGGNGAIVLMPDGPTVGGYPKIGVVAGVDIGALAQKTPGERVRFELIGLREAQRLLRETALADARPFP